jgi:hypothetical protein
MSLTLRLLPITKHEVKVIIMNLKRDWIEITKGIFLKKFFMTLPMAKLCPCDMLPLTHEGEAGDHVT